MHPIVIQIYRLLNVNRKINKRMNPSSSTHDTYMHTFMNVPEHAWREHRDCRRREVCERHDKAALCSGSFSLPFSSLSLNLRIFFPFFFLGILTYCCDLDNSDREDTTW